MKRLTLSQRMILFLVVFVLVVAFLTGRMVISFFEDYRIASQMHANLILMSRLSDLLTSLQRERGISATFLGGGVQADQVLKERKATDENLEKLYPVIDVSFIPQETKGKFKQSLQRLQNIRSRVDNHEPAEEIFSDYSGLIESALFVDREIANAKTSKGIGKGMVTVLILETSKENLGRFRGMGSHLVASKKELDEKQLKYLTEAWGSFQGGLRSPALVLPPSLERRLTELPSSPSWQKGFQYFGKIISGEYLGLNPSEVFQVYTDMISDMNKIISDLNSDLMAKTVSIKSEAQRSLILNSLLAIFIVVLVVVGALLTLISTQRQLMRAVSTIESAALQVDRASKEISEVGKTLSDGTSRQAASVEETAAAVEELSSIAAQNSEHARRANELVAQTAGAVHEAGLSMKKLVEAMEGITKASEETVKIVKTIDEIAFQTNLLALNAAVEAARAGEAGAGFAVVADEVRSLAMRSAEAAKTTSELIENTLKRIKEGGVILQAASKEFERIEDNTQKVKNIIDEIAAASVEQAEGVSQINRAISDIDTVVQNTAAQAEELASSAEDLVSQVSALTVELEGLNRLIYGDRRYVRGEGRGLVSSYEPRKAVPVLQVSREPLRSLRERKDLPKERGTVVRPQKTRIRPLIEWTEDFSVGVQEIDEQHKRLVSMLNQLNEAMKLGQGKQVVDRILFNLGDYVQRHFATEEAYMEAGSYPELERHKDIHRRLTAKVKDYMERYEKGEPGLTLELLDFLTGWLKNHILQTDKAYSPYVKGVKIDQALF